jgi:hypothetical protein
MGQNSSFMCSQVDSFTPENGAIQAFPPSQSYKKCNTVPPSEVDANPISCQSPIDLFIKPPSVFIKYIPAMRGIYTNAENH